MSNRSIAVFVLILASVVSVSAANTTHYVDSVGGNDGNAGTSKATPWKTPAKVSSATFAAGDRILFKRNCQFTGTLVLHGSGTSTGPVTIDAYGTGSKPVIIGDATPDYGRLATPILDEVDILENVFMR